MTNDPPSLCALCASVFSILYFFMMSLPMALRPVVVAEFT